MIFFHFPALLFEENICSRAWCTVNLQFVCFVLFNLHPIRSSVLQPKKRSEKKKHVLFFRVMFQPVFGAPRKAAPLMFHMVSERVGQGLEAERENCGKYVFVERSPVKSTN